MFWENKVVPTTYDSADKIVRPDKWKDDEITYAWLGHATVLINFYGTRILTDPVLLDRIGPPEIFDNLFGIKRLKELPLDAEKLSDIDLVLISHPHFDHLDLASLELLSAANDYTAIVPALTKNLLASDIYKTTELDWMSRAKNIITYSDLSVSAFRVEHYGYADWGDRKTKRGFNGYLIRSTTKNKSIAFFGDTSYSRFRDENGDVLTKPVDVNWRLKFDEQLLEQGIDLCIIPIGDSYYYWNHISPEKAVELAEELNCKKLLPIHYATFLLTPPDKVKALPKKALIKSLGDSEKGILVKCQSLTKDYIFPDIGETCRL